MKKIIMTLGVLGFVFVANAQTETKEEVKKVKNTELIQKKELNAPNKATKLKSTQVQKANISTDKKAVLMNTELENKPATKTEKKEVVAEPRKEEKTAE